MNTEIEIIHEELLVLLDFFHSFCIEHNINYSLHGGTLLGAIREKGFIPWDDDADVTMDRRNFDKFCQAVKNAELPDEFRFVDDNRFPQFVMKREGKPVVWTDVFVYDYISENRFAQKAKMAGTRFHILFTRTIDDQKLSNVNGLYKGIVKLGMNAIVYFAQIFPRKFRMKCAKKFMTKFPGKREYVHRSNDTRVGSTMILPAKINDEYEIISFKSIELMIVKAYDTVLTSSYGPNYMTPVKDKSDKIHSIALQREQAEMEKYFS